MQASNPLQTPPPQPRTILPIAWAQALANSLRQEVPDLQIQALLDGLKQAYQGKPLALDNARIEQILAQHEAQSAADAQRPQSEKHSLPSSNFSQGK